MPHLFEPGPRRRVKNIASQVLVGRLIEGGVELVFGLPGDRVNGITAALRRHRDRVRLVLPVTGRVGTPPLGTRVQQEVHLDRAFEDVSDDDTGATVPVCIPTLARGSVAHLTLPVDLLRAGA